MRRSTSEIGRIRINTCRLHIKRKCIHNRLIKPQKHHHTQKQYQALTEHQPYTNSTQYKYISSRRTTTTTSISVSRRNSYPIEQLYTFLWIL